MTDRWDTRTDNLGGRNGAPKRTYGDLCLVSPDGYLSEIVFNRTDCDDKLCTGTYSVVIHLNYFT